MEKVALFIRHRAKPGQRHEVQKVWEKHVKARVQMNPFHEAYVFCHDKEDPDAVCVFQLLSSGEALTDFMAGDWYEEYLSDLTTLLVDPPKVSVANPQWMKGL